MDPITRAAVRFQAEAEALWRATPRRALRIVAEPSERGEVIKALRLAELAPDNRRPFFLFEAPFLEPEGYFNGLAAAIEEDYERVREGAAEEGVVLPAFGAVSGVGSGIQRAARSVERAAALLRGRLEGVMVALLPERVARAARFREAVEAWVRAPFSEGVRLAVLDSPGGSLEAILGREGARFAVDQGELFDFLEAMGGRGGGMGPAPSEGPALAASPALSEAQRLEIEHAMGRPLLSPEAGRALRAQLFAAARATRRGEHRAAAARYGEARALCQAEGLGVEEAMVLLALGGACLAARLEGQGVESFVGAAERARHAGAWPLVAHAWLAAGAVLAMQGRRDLAGQAYQAAGAAAERGGVGALREEARRMERACAVAPSAR